MISNLSYSTIKLSSALAQKSLAENALKESDFFIKSLLQSLPLPVYYKDAPGRYAGCNHAFESFVGKTSDEILGKTVFDINPADLASIYYDKDAELLSSPCRQIYESQARNASGELRNVIFHKASLTDASGAVSGIVGAMLDITELKLSEEKIRTLLGEKELILKEVHHRIKNYMNTVYGLLFLQSQSQDSPEATATLLDAADRVKSMLRLYDRLYRSEDDGELSLGQYLSSLVDEVISIFPRSRPVRVSASIDDVVLSAKVLSPLSIIVNELVTNSMKYAIKDRDEGAIAITVARNGGSMCMTNEDDGPGLPADFSFEGSPGFGMQLIQMLVLQMRGSIAIDQAKRSRIVMEIPER